MKLIQSRGTTLSSEIYKLIMYEEKKKNCLCSARSLLFYRLKIVLCCVVFLCHGIFESRNLHFCRYCHIETRSDKSIQKVVRVYVCIVIFREIKLFVVIFKTYSYPLRKKTVSSILLSRLIPYVDETIGDHYPI